VASIRSLVPLIFSTQIIVSVGLTGWLSFENGQKAVNEMTIRLRSQVAERIDDHLYSYLAKPALVVDINVNQIEAGFFDAENLMNPEQLKHLERFLWKKITLFNSVSAILIANEKGQFIEVEQENDESRVMKLADGGKEKKLDVYAIDSRGNHAKLIRSRSGYDPRQRPYYKAAVRDKSDWSEIYATFSDRNRLTITAVQPVYNSQNKLLGVVGADLSLEQISKFLRNLKISPSGRAFIMEPSGDLVGSSSSEPIVVRGENGAVKQLKAVDSTDKLIQTTSRHLQQHFGNFRINKDTKIEFQEEEGRNFIEVRSLEQFGLNWLIVVVIPEKDFMNDIEANNRHALLLCLALLLVAILVGLRTSRWLIRPILTLSAVASAMEREDYGEGIAVKLLEKDTKRQDEFGQLARIFQKTLHEVRVRAESLKAQIDHLKVDIDREQKAQQVKAITETEFFKDLKSKAGVMRQKRTQNSSNFKVRPKDGLRQQSSKSFYPKSKDVN
jgi:HAMP domain-containing protein